MPQLSPDDAFRDFSRADDLPDALERFSSLLSLVRTGSEPGIESTFSCMKSAIQTEEAKNLWKLLDARSSHEEYWNGERRVCQGMNILIVGAGPCGLRMAIEGALLGARVVVVEKRNYFSRNNILHLWPFALHDLKAIGAKIFYPKFGSGCLDNIGTRKLQLLLLKISLLLGVEIFTPVEFIDVIEEKSTAGVTEWKAKFGEDGNSVNPPDISYNVIIGADGRHQTVKGFPQKVTRGKMAIAVLVNFINKKTRAEIDVKEVPGLVYFCDQNFFNNIKADTGIELENFVYYKEDTHYFVMCAKKSCLLSKGVIKKDINNASQLLAPNNISRTALLDFAREATHGVIGHIPDLEFALNHHGEEDVAIFDFTSLYQAENSCYSVSRQDNKILYCCIGDALSQPFWPTGTGVAKGFLSVMDAAWLIRGWALGEQTPLELIGEREGVLKLLSSVTPQKLSDVFKRHTINPATRYKTKGKPLSPRQVEHLYLTSDTPEGSLPSRRRKMDDEDQAEPPKKPTLGGVTLLSWFQTVLEPFKDVAPVTDLFNSWKNGLAFCALVQSYRPNLIDVRKLNPAEAVENTEKAFTLLEEEFGVMPLLSPEDFKDSGTVDNLSLLSYLFTLYQTLKEESCNGGHVDDKISNVISNGKRSKNSISANKKLRDIVAGDNYEDCASFNSLSTIYSRGTLKRNGHKPDARSTTLRHTNHSSMYKQFQSFHQVNRVFKKSKKQKNYDASSLRRGNKSSVVRHNAVKRKSNLPNDEENIKPVEPLKKPEECNIKPVEPTTSPENVKIDSPKPTKKVVDVTRKPLEPSSSNEHGHPSLMFCRGVRDRISQFNMNPENNNTKPSSNRFGPGFKSPYSPIIEKGDEGETGSRRGSLGVKDTSNGSGDSGGSKPVPSASKPAVEPPKPAPRGSKPVSDMPKPVPSESEPVNSVSKQLPGGSVPNSEGVKDGEGDSPKVSDMTSRLEDMAVFDDKTPQSSLTSSSICSVCKKSLYIVDRMVAHGGSLHINCFKCSTCEIRLRLDNSRVIKGRDGEMKLYCFHHYYEADGLTAVWKKEETGHDHDPIETHSEFSLHGPDSQPPSDDDNDTYKDARDFTDGNDDDEDDDDDEEFYSYLSKHGYGNGDGDGDGEGEDDEERDVVNDIQADGSDTDDEGSVARRFKNAVSMSLILNNALQEISEQEEQLNDQGRLVENTLRRNQRQSRIMAAEESDELIQEWLSVIQRKIELCDQQSQIMLRARLVELQDLERDRLSQLELYKQQGLSEKEGMDWIEEDVTRLTSEIADLQDFLDIHRYNSPSKNIPGPFPLLPGPDWPD